MYNNTADLNQLEMIPTDVKLSLINTFNTLDNYYSNKLSLEDKLIYSCMFLSNITGNIKSKFGEKCSSIKTFPHVNDIEDLDNLTLLCGYIPMLLYKISNDNNYCYWLNNNAYDKNKYINNATNFNKHMCSSNFEEQMIYNSVLYITSSYYVGKPVFLKYYGVGIFKAYKNIKDDNFIRTVLGSYGDKINYIINMYKIKNYDDYLNKLTSILNSIY